MKSSVIVILIVLVILGIVIIAAISRNRKPGPGTGQDPVRESHNASDADRQHWREWSSRAQRLEQEMVLLTGGKNGMVMQRESFRNPESPQMAEEYRENFLVKQRRLQEACIEYEELREKVAALPEGSGKPLPQLADRELYKELLQETLS